MFVGLYALGQGLIGQTEYAAILLLGIATSLATPVALRMLTGPRGPAVLADAGPMAAADRN